MAAGDRLLTRPNDEKYGVFVEFAPRGAYKQPCSRSELYSIWAQTLYNLHIIASWAGVVFVRGFANNTWLEASRVFIADLALLRMLIEIIVTNTIPPINCKIKSWFSSFRLCCTCLYAKLRFWLRQRTNCSFSAIKANQQPNIFHIPPNVIPIANGNQVIHHHIDGCWIYMVHCRRRFSFTSAIIRYIRGDRQKSTEVLWTTTNFPAKAAIDFHEQSAPYAFVFFGHSVLCQLLVSSRILLCELWIVGHIHTIGCLSISLLASFVASRHGGRPNRVAYVTTRPNPAAMRHACLPVRAWMSGTNKNRVFSWNRKKKQRNSKRFMMISLDISNEHRYQARFLCWWGDSSKLGWVKHHRDATPSPCHAQQHIAHVHGTFSNLLSSIQYSKKPKQKKNCIIHFSLPVLMFNYKKFNGQFATQHNAKIPCLD